jgi:N-acetylglucosaminyl-diphospho-decaprenol L-rhamnosyltransferase
MTDRQAEKNAVKCQRAHVIPSLDIVIVNWNAGAQLQQCLDSIRSARCEVFELLRVVVVDNASSDGSANQLEASDLPLVMIRNQANRGFAAACNQGARNSRANYLLFLNPDCRLLSDSLSASLHYMEQPEHMRTGIAGIQLLNFDGSVSRSCVRFPTPVHMMSAALGLARLSPKRFPHYPMTTWDHLETREVDHVIGAFTLIRRAVFEQLGGYDERFFVYLEDLDLSQRMSKLGFTSAYLTSTRAVHQGGGCSGQAKAQRLFYSLRSRILYCYKHFGWVPATSVTLATLMIEPFLRLVYAVSREGLPEIRDTFKAYATLLPWSVKWWFKRNQRSTGNLSSKTRQPEGSNSRNREWDNHSGSDRVAAVIHSEGNR